MKRATGAVAAARNLGFDVVIVDTAGRLHVLFKMFNRSIRAVLTTKDVVPLTAA